MDELEVFFLVIVILNLCFLKEIINEDDDDIATATLESLNWDLERAIEANEIIQIDSTVKNSQNNPYSFFNNEIDNDIEIIQPNH